MLRRLASPPTHRRSVEPAERELLDQESFLGLVRKERMRADRTGDELSLAAIRLGTPGRGADPGLYHALTTILGRIRCLDEAGWLRPGTLGILLPATSVAGARKLVGDLGRNDITGHLRYGRWVLYSDPEDWVEDEDTDDGAGNGHHGNGHHGNGRSRIEEARIEEDLGSARPPSGTLSASRETPADVRSLVDLLEVPLPWWKRAIDVVGSAVGLVLLSPVFLLTALAVKLGSPGPVFYTSRRAGVRGQPFRFFKFRTMYLDAEQRKADLLAHNEVSGPVFKMTNDPRITPVGRVLRKTSIDELPQLWNVLRGDMSLVGPRPPLPEETRFYAPWQRRRLEGKGGLTCIWQVSGRSNVQFEDWVRMDIHYLERRSLWRDLLILVQTFPAVFSCRGAK